MDEMGQSIEDNEFRKSTPAPKPRVGIAAAGASQ